MTSNFFSPEDWVFVNEYTKSDGTHVDSYWRHKYGKNISINNYNKKTGSFELGANVDDWLGIPSYSEIKSAGEEYLVENITKQESYNYGKVFSMLTGNDNAFELYEVASPDKNYNSEYVQKNGKMYNSTSELGDEKLAKKIKARLYLEGTGMDDCKVFDMHEDSSLSKKIAQSDEIKDLLKGGLPMLKYSGYLPVNTVEFITPDLYNSLHGANISSAKIDSNGDLHMVLEDLYNFNSGRTSVKGRIGEKFQNQGSIEPYYLKINVKIKKSDLDKY